MFTSFSLSTWFQKEVLSPFTKISRDYYHQYEKTKDGSLSEYAVVKFCPYTASISFNSSFEYKNCHKNHIRLRVISYTNGKGHKTHTLHTDTALHKHHI